MLARGERVVAACRQPGRATALNALAGEYPGRLHVLPLEVAAAKSRAELVRELPLVLGGGEDAAARLDLLVNNAGVLHPGERFGRVDPAVLEDSLRTNAIAPFLLAQALAPWLRDAGPDGRGGAKISNLSAQLGSIAGTARFGTPSYAISKAAQNMASVLLAQALADRGIVVLALHPGWVQTDMGGARATLAANDAVQGLLRVVDAAGPADSGCFRDWRGDPLPW